MGITGLLPSWDVLTRVTGRWWPQGVRSSRGGAIWALAPRWRSHGGWEPVNTGQFGIAPCPASTQDSPEVALSPQNSRLRGAALAAGPRRPALTTWQVNLAKSLLTSRLSQQVTISEVAGACRLSRCYFTKAFTESVGTAPYTWLIERRIERSCSLIAGSTMPLSQIALECGFADQSHFSKAFVKQIGIAPARWRQHCRQGELHGSNGPT